jgi:hypothetical protein
MNDNCEHIWKPLSQTVKGLYVRVSDQVGDYRHEKVGEVVVATIYCEKCGEIKEKQF